MNVLIAPDKFKGTLTAVQAAEAIAAGWRRARPQDTLDLFPISDGGDGFGELLARHLGAEEHTVDTVDAAHRPLRASWWWEPRSRMAIIESARVIGLAMLPPGRFHPFELDTSGLGAVMQAAATLRPKVCLLGIGGSATNDGGFGMARALGWQFLDRKGRPIEAWTRLPELARLERPSHPLRLGQLIVAMDVRNRLMGVRGATQIYGPQKGIRPEDVKPAERCLRRLVRIVGQQFRFSRPPEHACGAGAAGGLGYGLLSFANARLEIGFNLFARMSSLRRHVDAADLVITGEGAIDLTTLAMGKGVGRIAGACGRHRCPCLALAGVAHLGDHSRERFDALYAITPTLTTPERAMAEPAFWLSALAERAAREWPPAAKA